MTQANVEISLRTCKRPSFTEYYLTAQTDLEDAPAGATVALMNRVAEVVAQERIQPIQEKLYGLRAAMQGLLEARHTAFCDHGLDPSLPVTFVEGTPVAATDLAGVQLWGVVPADPAQQIVATVHGDARQPGRLWEGDGFKMLYLPLVRGVAPDGSLPCDPISQAQSMFGNANAALEANGFSYSDVVRTWIYLARLLDWYRQFNRVRTDYHRKVGLGCDPKRSIFPASTGIQGCHAAEECFMDVLALRSSDTASVVSNPIRHTSRQGEAFSYGSAFSRGMALAVEDKQTVFVSGTASVNPAGQTIHRGDAEMQSIETLLNIAALLADQKGRLQDICQATVFCKDLAALTAYHRVRRLLQIPAFPSVYVLADVCRPELLIEIEAVAVV